MVSWSGVWSRLFPSFLKQYCYSSLAHENYQGTQMMQVTSFTLSGDIVLPEENKIGYVT